MTPGFPQPEGGSPARVRLLAPGEEIRPSWLPGTVIHFGGPAKTGLVCHHNLPRFFALSPEQEKEVQGFFWFALAVWLADKAIPRRLGGDGWTRRLQVEFPATPSWLPLGEAAAGLLDFLTGDVWRLQPRKTRAGLPLGTAWPRPWQPTAVCLFSGGLDSLAGAIDLLEEGHRLLLVSHYDYGQLAALQQSLAAALRNHYGPDRLFPLGARVQFEGPELTLRSRSLLYLSLGVLAANAFSPALPLFVPENGWISLNPPLTLNRLGTLSTRTTHPFFLEGISALWRRAGLSQRLLNPYQELSKGEVLQKCANLRLLAQLAPLTVSCARPMAGRWRRERGQACGYCYPCLIRRAALHSLGLDQGNQYRVEILQEPGVIRERVKGRHLRALCLAVRTWETQPEEMLSRLLLPGGRAEPPLNLRLAQRLLAAGFSELSLWLREKGGPEVQRFLGSEPGGGGNPGEAFPEAGCNPAEGPPSPDPWGLGRPQTPG